MIISHHGEPEFGAAVRPMFLEAEILSSLDTLDAKIYEIEQACRNVQPGEFTPASGRSTTASSITMTATTPISRRS